MRWRPASVVILWYLAAVACGSPAGGAAPTRIPTDQELRTLADKVIWKENGAAPDAGNDYSACPITGKLRGEMEKTQADFCPCEQNPSSDRMVTVTPRPGGGVIIYRLYGGRVKTELLAVVEAQQVLISEVAAKGDLESEPISFQEQPSPTPSIALPPPAPPSRVLNVPWNKQVYHLSCEEASLRMALAFEGIATTDDAILKIIGTDSRPAYFEPSGALRWGDPYASFVGNPNGSEVALTGYGTYYSTIARAARESRLTRSTPRFWRGTRSWPG